MFSCLYIDDTSYDIVLENEYDNPLQLIEPPLNPAIRTTSDTEMLGSVRSMWNQSPNF